MSTPLTAEALSAFYPQATQSLQHPFKLITPTSTPSDPTTTQHCILSQYIPSPTSVSTHNTNTLTNAPVNTNANLTKFYYREPKQTTSTIVMVCPNNFGFNPQTAVDNHYQKNTNESTDMIRNEAFLEFQNFVQKLRKIDVQVIVFNNQRNDTPDSLFPNNWVSFSPDGSMILYPMAAENRRLERCPEALLTLLSSTYGYLGVIEDEICDKYENNGQFLEGTGGMIFDHLNRYAYCALSQRANEEAFLDFCNQFNWVPICFRANQTVREEVQVKGKVEIKEKRVPIYHTNVMLSIGDRFAVVCLDSIDDDNEKDRVVKAFNDSNREIVSISEKQVEQFCGNVLQIENKNGDKYLIMSQSAFDGFTDEQRAILGKYSTLLPVPLTTIETYGGGSARCMLAELYLPHVIDNLVEFK
jgi:hypothetical protein